MKNILLTASGVCLALLLAACGCQSAMEETQMPTAGDSTPAVETGNQTAPVQGDTVLDYGDFLEQDTTQTPPGGQTQSAGSTVPATTPVRPDEPATPTQPTTPAQPTAPVQPIETVPVVDTTPTGPAQTQATQPQETVPETTVSAPTVPAIEEDGYQSQIIRP